LPTNIGADLTTQNIVVETKVPVLTDMQKKVVGNNTVFEINVFVLNGEEQSTIGACKPEMEVAVPFELKGQNPNQITVYMLDENGKVKNMKGSYDAELGTVSFITNNTGKYFIKVNPVEFNDINGKYAWAKNQIQSLASKEIIEGEQKNIFNPSGNITRAQFVKMVVCLFGLEDKNANTTFKDVNKNDWFYTYVSAAEMAQIIDARTKGTFRPNESITRQDMAIMLAKALVNCREMSKRNVSDINFSDKASIDNLELDYIATAIKCKLIEGYPDGSFKPNANASRAEAVEVMYKALRIK
jgi:hypothetical protein